MFALDNLAVHAGLSGKGYDVHHCRSLTSSSEVILVLGGGWGRGLQGNETRIQVSSVPLTPTLGLS